MPTDTFKELWDGGEDFVPRYRFAVIKTSTRFSLKTRVFDNLTNIRNYFIKRVCYTVKKFIDNPPKGFGLEKYSAQERLNSLHDLVEDGIDRCSRDTKFLPLAIFHAFATETEMKINKIRGSQKCLLSTQQMKKGNEMEKLNGSIIEDNLWESDVAMIITIVANNLVRLKIIFIIVILYFDIRYFTINFVIIRRSFY